MALARVMEAWRRQGLTWEAEGRSAVRRARAFDKCRLSRRPGDGVVPDRRGLLEPPPGRAPIDRGRGVGDAWGDEPRPRDGETQAPLFLCAKPRPI